LHHEEHLPQTYSFYQSKLSSPNIFQIQGSNLLSVKKYYSIKKAHLYLLNINMLYALYFKLAYCFGSLNKNICKPILNPSVLSFTVSFLFLVDEYPTEVSKATFLLKKKLAPTFAP